MLPPVSWLLGSTASTAIFSLYSSIRNLPSASIRLLFPAPGTPVMPTRSEWPLDGRQSSMICSANSRSAARELSMRVMACARMARSPLRMPSRIRWRESALRRLGACGVAADCPPGMTRSALSSLPVTQSRPPTRLRLRTCKICCAAAGITVPGPYMPATPAW